MAAGCACAGGRHGNGAAAAGGAGTGTGTGIKIGIKIGTGTGTGIRTGTGTGIRTRSALGVRRRQGGGCAGSAALLWGGPAGKKLRKNFNYILLFFFIFSRVEKGDGKALGGVEGSGGILPCATLLLPTSRVLLWGYGGCGPGSTIFSSPFLSSLARHLLGDPLRDHKICAGKLQVLDPGRAQSYLSGGSVLLGMAH